MTTNIGVVSDMAISPGEVLQEEIEARGMTQKELAARLGRPPQVINEIIRAKKAITPHTAIGLGKVLGIDPQYWINLETDYRMTLARNQEKAALANNVEWLDAYPIREMIRRGWIEAGLDKISRLKALLAFLEVAVPEPFAYQEAVGFRITPAAQKKVSAGALTVWLRKGELEARERSIADYDAGVFREALDGIRQMTEAPPAKFVPAMTALCAQAGVALCLVPELPKSGANGAARWLSARKALIQLSIRDKWADIFWFTFFHEACHLLHHRTRRRLVIDGIADPDTAELEVEANQFARDLLIPPEAWQVFCKQGSFTSQSVGKFARSIQIAPFIVVGRLQKEKRLPYNQLTSLKCRYVWCE
ncbi:hypothetical protein NKDENANG_03778 [Candidatus Entotheonellaceae bacterium PAL068K]